MSEQTQTETGCRYSFNMRRGYNWKAMLVFYRSPFFWRMWGVKRTLSYMLHDTFDAKGRGTFKP